MLGGSELGLTGMAFTRWTRSSSQLTWRMQDHLAGPWLLCAAPGHVRQSAAAHSAGPQMSACKEPVSDPSYASQSGPSTDCILVPLHAGPPGCSSHATLAGIRRAQDGEHVGLHRSDQTGRVTLLTQLGVAAGVQRAQTLATQAWMLVLLTHWSSKDLAVQRLGLEAGLLRYSL